MSGKKLQKYIKTLRTKSGVGSHHEKHCRVDTTEKRQKHSGKLIHCFVVNEEVNISPIGECLRVGCSHPQSGLRM